MPKVRRPLFVLITDKKKDFLLKFSVKALFFTSFFLSVFVKKEAA